MSRHPRTQQPDPVALAAVGRAVRDAGYTVDGVATALGAQAAAALAAGDEAPARIALAERDGDPRTTLVRLFLLGDTVPRADAERSLPVAAARALGLVRADPERVRALLEVRPYGEPDRDWWVVSDHDRHGRTRRVVDGSDPASVAAEPDRPGAAALAADHVLGVGGASLTLARISPRPRVARALDVGTGCGVQALHLTRHAGEVTVTDVNPRALRCAALTAGLSGVRWRGVAGSLFDPVADETFDLVVSNPPFVISPSARYAYRDAGLPADDLGRRFLADVPARLAPGGWCAVLLNWLHVDGQDWRERVGSWVAGSGCDAWVVQRDVQDPVAYAGTWLRDAGETAHLGRYQEWLAGLSAMGATGVGMGWVVLHDSGREDPRIEVEDLGAAARLPRGDEVVDRFTAGTVVQRLGAVGLLDAALRPAADMRVVRTSVGGRSLPARVDRAGGWRPAVTLDDALLAVVESCDGSRSLGVVVDTVAAVRGVEPVDLLAATLVTVRALVTDGTLVLA